MDSFSTPECRSLSLKTLDAEPLGPFAYIFAGCHRKTCVCLTQFSKSILLSNLKSPPLCTADSIIPKSKMKPSNLKLELLKFDGKLFLELIIDPTLSASPLVRCNQETLPMTRWICDSGDVGDVGSSLSADNFNKQRARQSRNLVDAGTADGRNGRETSKFLELRSLESPRIAWVWMYISERSHDWCAPATIRICQCQVTRGPAWQ